CNLNGYGNLSETITLARRRSPKGRYCLRLTDLAEPAPALAHLRGLPDCLVILKPEPDVQPAVLNAHLQALRTVFEQRLWVGVTLLHGPSDAHHLATARAAGERLGVPLVALGGVEMHRRSRQPLHDTLAAIRHGRPDRKSTRLNSSHVKISYAVL